MPLRSRALPSASTPAANATAAPRLHGLRGEIVHFLADPATHGSAALEHFADGVLLIADGCVAELGPANDVLAKLPAGVPLSDQRGRLILPGFIDTHVHYAQTDMIASPGEQLLEWLQRYALPAEQRFADAGHAAEVADFFCDELLRNGTTTAMAFATVHAASVDALFAAAQQRRMRLVTGKVLMDRNCPPELRDSAELGDAQSRQLIERWHGRARLRYAITPRFAGSSSAAQMSAAAALFARGDGLHLQSHVAENRAEVAWMKALYPQARSYLDIHDGFGQLGERAIYAHCIWIDDTDRARMAATGSAISFCPTSNLFLGSGLFDLAAAQAHGVRVGLGTDVGAGTSFSMLATMNEAYKVLQLQGQTLSPASAFYLATLGGARSLYLDDWVGNFAVGKEADFVILDPQATPLTARRWAQTQTLAEGLFVLMMLGDDRHVAATGVLGDIAHARRTRESGGHAKE